MLSVFKNLRLAHRLAMAFGALGVAIIVVAVIGVIGLGSVERKTKEISEVSMPAVELAGHLDARTQTIVLLVSQHLYVFDGQLAEQDRLVAEIKPLREANNVDSERLDPLLDGTPADAKLQEVIAVRKQLITTYLRALDLAQRDAPQPRRRSA